MGVGATGVRRAAWLRRRASVVEEGQIELAQARRLGDRVDLNNLAAPEGTPRGSSRLERRERSMSPGTLALRPS
jgi:hypothetical protein